MDKLKEPSYLEKDLDNWLFFIQLPDPLQLKLSKTPICGILTEQPSEMQSPQLSKKSLLKIDNSLIKIAFSLI